MESPAGTEMAKVHDRMPIFLHDRESVRAWLTEPGTSELISKCEKSAGDFVRSRDALKIYDVSDYVNKSANEGEKCIVNARDVKKSQFLWNFGAAFVKKKPSSQVAKKEQVKEKQEVSSDQLKVEKSVEGKVESQKAEAIDVKEGDDGESAVKRQKIE